VLYEIDFLPVGDGESSGDAICLRYSFDQGLSWHVGIIDGGTQASGEALCNHIKQYYGTEIVDFLVCTHPHQDHAAGLACVIENLTVKKVLMHCPWDYVDYLFDKGYVTDGRVTRDSLRKTLIDGLPYAYKVYELASEKGIPVHHAFSDGWEAHNIPSLFIAGPSTEFYIQQLLSFNSITSATVDATKSSSLMRSVMEMAKKVVNWIAETWDDEKLVDPEDNATSPENNSGIVLCFDFNGKKHLLTGDCGVPALEQSANYLESAGIALQDFSFIQASHHGSKRNTGPTILNRLVGYPVAQGTETGLTVFVSATKEQNPKHPSKRVVNAFIRRGGKVVATQGSTICHSATGVPHRGWGAAVLLPFYSEVEEDDND